MTTEDMDADLEAYTSAEKLSQRLGYWERRFKLTSPTAEQLIAYGDVATKHARRVAAVMRAG